MVDTRGQQIDEIHRRVGRNVLLFQRVEQGLRSMLPYLHPDGSKKGLDAMRKYRDKTSDKSLGVLIGHYTESLDGDRELIAAELKALVDSRNDLMHYFFRNERFNLLAPDGAAAALKYLDEQYAHAQEWAEIFRVLSLATVLALMESDPKVGAEFEQYRDKLIAQLPDSLRDSSKA